VVDRRGLFAGAAALAITGCGTSAEDDEPGGAPEERSATSRQGDIELLQAALAIELASKSEHDPAHAEELRRALRERKAEPTTRPDPVPTDPGRAIAFYLDMLPKVYDERLRSTIASILVVEAQQLAAGSKTPPPDAFVYGTQS
jgi:hypothetical protein